ncbi:MAG: GNAT family N-acetyltransferase [Alphaproteobacteria bacterium]|jgi:RimJ/RimL family protein N-acetyltransferase|nr:GNAT family N-acetyltransferase [Alphaproteobacteria bacterium]MBU0803881.1 GNAT family N-acetyltransferase [Alphaproteobacteria bacterium]MBU0872822.1 GNAT family N-acetyltransferase [Alphaproteobacteria bacterium]MBU1402808.1 GNAT family N-acetyltransferase [Alphaproteobacteria bacterium]MBU1593450.1 GNAT family N-acetyltransferase [Alphaproteobacteria bacterium]
MTKFTQAPVIETERVILRPHRLEDFDAYQAMWTDPKVTRFIGGRAHTREESWVRFLRHTGTWSMLGYGYWAIEAKAGGALVGEAGFQDMKRSIEPSIEGIPEAGWALAPAFQGIGLATEVIGRAAAWIDANLGGRTVCIIAPDNAASIKVAQKCGYREVLATSYHDKPIVLFERAVFSD